MKTFILLLFLSITSTYPQIYMIGVAPLKPGNLWKYVDIGSFGFESNFYVTDSIATISNSKYTIVEMYSDGDSIRHKHYMRLNKDNYYLRYHIYEDSVYKYYKKDCAIGDSWIQLWPPFYKFYYSVIDTFTISTFEHQFFSKVIRITDSSLVEIYQVWSDSIGLLQENSIGQYDMILRGCVIDGIVYGDTNTYVSVEEDFYKSENFYLLQNYPNPFNPSTSIQFTLPEKSIVQLNVYNALGQKIATLINSEINSGQHTVVFNGAGLANGIYFYRIAIHSDKIQAGSFIETKKMILMK